MEIDREVLVGLIDVMDMLVTGTGHAFDVDCGCSYCPAYFAAKGMLDKTLDLRSPEVE